MEIKDSGTRREFNTGAVRDLAEGKGRCDLLPLEEVARILNTDGNPDTILSLISRYMTTGNLDFIRFAIAEFNRAVGWDDITSMLEVAKQYEDGANKYDERNWEKGIPLHCYVDSGIRHYLKNLRGDKDEPHDRAFVWNMLGLIWTHTNKPGLNDLPFKKGEQNE